MNKQTSYHEELLHYIWAQQYLNITSLQTDAGSPVTIYDPGYTNPTDGPDFLNARLSIGGLCWHGDVEIHWSAQDWFRHGHHTDANYNRVVLHVVFNKQKTVSVTRQDGSLLPVLSLQPYLNEPLQYFFRRYLQADSLPCAAFVSSISSDVFEKQINRAHKEYFDQKVDDLLRFYDPGLPISQAWPDLLIRALFDGLGIAHNRQPMQKLAEHLLSQPMTWPNKHQFIRYALKEAGIHPTSATNEFNWKRKGSRPNNHPKIRIRQGCELLWFIKKRAFKEWMRTSIDSSFKKIIQQVASPPGLGAERGGTLFGTVWLPAMYILGDLLADKKRMTTAYESWFHHHTKLPGSITKHFKQAGIAQTLYRKKLGTVHQFRTYCQPHRCDRCNVFKSIISA